MKKFLAAVAAAVVALVTPLSVVADSPSGQIVIDKKEEILSVRPGMSISEVDETWGTDFANSYGKDFSVIWVGDAHVTPSDATKVPARVVNAADFGGNLVIHNGKSVQGGASITLHAGDLSPVIILASPSYVASVNPAPAAPAAAATVPNTGDTNNGIWAGALVVSVVAAGAALYLNRK